MRDLLALIDDPDLTVGRRAELGGQLTEFLGNAKDRRDKLRAQVAMAEEFVRRLEGLQPPPN